MVVWSPAQLLGNQPTFTGAVNQRLRTSICEHPLRWHAAIPRMRTHVLWDCHARTWTKDPHAIFPTHEKHSSSEEEMGPTTERRRRRWEPEPKWHHWNPGTSCDKARKTPTLQLQWPTYSLSSLSSSAFDLLEPKGSWLRTQKAISKTVWPQTPHSTNDLDSQHWFCGPRKPLPLLLPASITPFSSWSDFHSSVPGQNTLFHTSQAHKLPSIPPAPSNCTHPAYSHHMNILLAQAHQASFLLSNSKFPRHFPSLNPDFHPKSTMPQSGSTAIIKCSRLVTHKG